MFPKAARFAATVLAAALAVTTLAGCSSDDPDPATSSSGSDEQVEIVFIGESSSTDVIWSYRAAQMKIEAEKHGANFTDRYAEGDYAKQAQMIEEEVARGVNAIIAPFFDPTVANEAIKKAIDAGVAVYAILGVPELPDDYSDKIAKAYTDWGDVGAMLAEVSTEYIADGDTVVWPAEAPDGTYITDAVTEFKSALASEGKNVTVDVLDATSDPTTAASTILSYLISHPDTAALATSGAICIGAANTAMTQGNLTAGSPPLFGQVVNPSSTNGILDGYMPAGVNLELTESSYEAVRVVLDMLETGNVPDPVTVPLVVVQKDNIETTVPEGLRS